MADTAVPDASDDPQPVAPDPDNFTGCCDSGCTPCIFDLYWEAMAKYEVALAEWRARHPERAA